MTFDKTDLSLIRSSIVAAVALCCVGFLLGGYAIWRYVDASQERTKQLAQLSSKILRVERLRADFDQVRLYADAYQSLLREGAVGNFAKSTAVDQFERAIKRQPVPVKGYKLTARVPVTSGDMTQFGRYSLFRYELSFDAQPLHEERFVGFMNQLRSNIAGLSTLESCQLKRAQKFIEGAGLESSDQPRIEASCSVRWYAFSPTEAEADLGAAPAMN